MYAKFPLWLFPLSLISALLILLGWNFAHHNNDDLNILKPYLERSYSSEKASSKKIPSQVIPKNLKALDLDKRFQLGISYFRAASYREASIVFQSLYNKININSELSYKIASFYAFSLLLSSQRNYSLIRIQDSYDVFSILLSKLPVNNLLFAHTVLGYAQASRYLKHYPSSMDIYLKEASVRTYTTLKNKLLVELGYYYFFIKDYEDALTTFSNIKATIDSPTVIEDILKSEKPSALLIPILENKLLSPALYGFFKENIYQKILVVAINNLQAGNYFEAEHTLNKLFTLFPDDNKQEDILFLLANSSYKQKSYQNALSKYLKVLNNMNTKRDPQSLYAIANIYIYQHNIKSALYYFSLLVHRYPHTIYAHRALAWVKNFSRYHHIPKQKHPRKQSFRHQLPPRTIILPAPVMPPRPKQIVKPRPKPVPPKKNYNVYIQKKDDQELKDKYDLLLEKLDELEKQNQKRLKNQVPPQVAPPVQKSAPKKHADTTDYLSQLQEDWMSINEDPSSNSTSFKNENSRRYSPSSQSRNRSQNRNRFAQNHNRNTRGHSFEQSSINQKEILRALNAHYPENRPKERPFLPENENSRNNSEPSHGDTPEEYPPAKNDRFE